jgi:hypothetical protein
LIFELELDFVLALALELSFFFGTQIEEMEVIFTI